MRHGFTLIELMIVIAIIAIIAAIAIPNLLESRITANESAAAASLKSGLLPGQTQFQSGAYSDIDSDGRGEYARNHQYLAGFTDASTNSSGVTAKPLTLIPPTYNQTEGTAVGAYKYQLDTDVGTVASNISNAESYFGAYAVPATSGDGRRAFGMNVSGVVFATKQSYSTSNVLLLSAVSGSVDPALNTGVFANANAILLSDPRTDNSTCTSNAAPYQK